MAAGRATAAAGGGEGGSNSGGEGDGEGRRVRRRPMVHAGGGDGDGGGDGVGRGREGGCGGPYAAMDLEGGRRWWSATAGDGSDGGGRGSWQRRCRLTTPIEDLTAMWQTATAKRPLAMAAVRGGGGSGDSG
ncbi:subtilase-like protein [Oryza sativa Japonica Group]|uniref:Subtilase-like protein n=1 Tax=Oryza sativa subsp. japonica TaxID=39947 RepID=Q5VR57_ORYSJ|nr:subtilase-like protein [Oryza sativa Japonica Group]